VINAKYIVHILRDPSIFEKVFIWFLGQPVKNLNLIFFLNFFKFQTKKFQTKKFKLKKKKLKKKLNLNELNFNLN
jgi:hypothetical protein